MKKCFLIGLLMSSILTLKAQKIFFQTGKNLTAYFFNDNVHPNVDLNNGTGFNYEFGYQSAKKNNKHLYYSISATLDQYNASGATSGMALSWETNYLGVKGAVYYAALNSKLGYLAIKLGIGAKSIVDGRQKINFNQMNLKDQPEFSGTFVGSGVGLLYNYNITPLFALQLGYNYDKQFNLSNKSQEKLSFNNNSLNVGFSIKID